jgi:GNAT superfamily N-acetyltransferase
MRPVRVREVRAQDFDAWKVLWDGYNAFYGREGPTALPFATTQHTWQRFLDAYEPMHALVAEAEGGALLGIAHYLYRRSTIEIQPACYLQDIFTADFARGQGVGQALLAEVYDRARAAGCLGVYWQTHESNTTAQRLYDRVAERTGFIVYRTRF